MVVLLSRDFPIPSTVQELRKYPDKYWLNEKHIGSSRPTGARVVKRADGVV